MCIMIRVNLNNEHPSWGCVRDTVQAISLTKGYRQFNYSRCGRKPWKVTRDVQTFLIRRLVARRASPIVTSTTLQADLAAEKGVCVEAS